MPILYEDKTLVCDDQALTSDTPNTLSGTMSRERDGLLSNF